MSYFRDILEQRKYNRFLRKRKEEILKIFNELINKLEAEGFFFGGLGYRIHEENPWYAQARYEKERCGNEQVYFSVRIQFGYHNLDWHLESSLKMVGYVAKRFLGEINKKFPGKSRIFEDKDVLADIFDVDQIVNQIVQYMKDIRALAMENIPELKELQKEINSKTDEFLAKKFT